MSPIVTASLKNSSPAAARLSIEQYQQMAETGILQDGTPIELLDGLLILKDRRDTPEELEMTIGHEHSDANEGLQEWLRRNLPDGYMFRIQQPILMPPNNLPEPDGAIVRGRRGAFKGTHPKPQDVIALFEIAHTSLAHDRTTKLKLYASAGIPKYVLINLKDRQAEVYSQPVPAEERFETCEIVPVSGILSLSLENNVQVSILVSDLLP